MSKLYNAISRLDEIAIAQEAGPALADIPFRQALERSGSSWLRMLLISAALLLFGLLAVGITAWWQDWFLLEQTTKVVSAPPPESPVAEAADQQMSAPAQVATGTAQSGDIGHRLPEKESPLLPLQRAEQQPSLPANMAENAAATVINRLPAKPLRKVLPVLSHPHPLVETTTEPKPLQLVEQLDAPVTDTASSRFIDQTAQLSRWLHQAEQRRRAGDWNGAIALFTKVWEISGNPGVANNLAASLMQVGRLPEAENILSKALQQTPDDQDLQQNLHVLQQLADK